MADAVRAAGAELHHLNLGPGAGPERDWQAAGLDYEGAILSDPLNIRYATDSTNISVWVMHNP